MLISPSIALPPPPPLPTNTDCSTHKVMFSRNNIEKVLQPWEVCSRNPYDVPCPTRFVHSFSHSGPEIYIQQYLKIFTNSSASTAMQIRPFGEPFYRPLHIYRPFESCPKPYMYQGRFFFFFFFIHVKRRKERY